MLMAHLQHLPQLMTLYRNSGFYVKKYVSCEQLSSLFLSPLVPQMSVYYYPSGQYPTSTTQQYRPLASVQYSAQRSQQIPQTTQQAGTGNVSFQSSGLVIFDGEFHSCTYWMNTQRENLSHMFPLPGETSKAIDSLCGKLKGARR